MLLHHLTSSSFFSFNNVLPVIALVSALNTTCAFADETDYLRQEPIYPIPLKTSADIKKAGLGEVLFFDTRLSNNNQISCASCHQLEAGGDDNVATGISSTGNKNTVNTPSVFNAMYNFRQNWDGSAYTLEDQVDLVMNSHHEFNSNWDDVISKLAKDSLFKTDFEDIYEQGLTRENIINAIVEFEKTLITPNARFDRYLRNEDEVLSSEELQGYQIFKELGCISCHQGINVGGNLFQKFGVFYNYIAERGDIDNTDYGRMNITNRQIDAFVFKVPSLRNVAVTAPYLHDGSAETIEEVISIMGKTQLGRSLTTSEITLIKAFLNTLTGEYKGKGLEQEQGQAS